MTKENYTSVVADSGCSINPESPIALENNVSIAPLDVIFFENGQPVPFENTDQTVATFYEKMRSNPRLPQTSGTITKKIYDLYEKNLKNEQSIISIHISSKLSGAYNSALTAKNLITEKFPHLLSKNKPYLYIDVIDSTFVSSATWFLIEQAASLAKQGYPVEDISKITLETIPKIETFTSLSTFENIVKGGRLSSAAGYLSSKLQIRPIAGIVDGEIIFQGLTRTNKNVQRALTDRVADTKEEIVKLAILHTNFVEAAELLKENLSKIYSGTIDIVEAGPVLGVHTGEKGLGIALQKK